MNLLSLNISNFGCFGKGVLVDIQPGLTFIVGDNRESSYGDSNGSGKTTIREAFVWCLFGRTTKDVLIDTVINNQVGKDCSVSALVSVDEKVYEITRYRKHKEFKNALIVKEQTADGVKEIKSLSPQEVVDSLVGIDFKTFINSIVCGHHSDFATMGDAEQKKMIENLFDVTIYDQLFELADEEMKTMQQKITKTNMDLSNVKGKITSIESVVSQVSCQVKQFESDKEDKITTIENNIKGLKFEIQSLEGSIEALEKQVVNKSVLGPDPKDIELLDKTKYDLRTLEFEKSKATTAISKIKHQLKHKASLKGKVCKECFTEISEKNIHKFESEKEEELQEYKAEIRQYEKAEGKLREEINRLTTKIEQINKAKAQHDREQERTLREISSTKEKLAGKKANLINKQEALKTAKESSPDDLHSILQKNKVQLAAFVEKEADLKTELLSLIDKEKAFTYWRQAFSNKGIRNQLFEKILPYLNNDLTKLANDLCGGEISIKISTETQIASGDKRNKLAILCESTSGGKTYASFSRGETARVNLCLTLALQRLVNALNTTKFGVLFYDEVFDSLDEKGIECAMRLLRRQTKKVRSVLVTTHNPNFLTHHAKIIRVVKEKKFSRVEFV